MWNINCNIWVRGWDFKGTLSGLRQFSATETPLKMMKNAFCVTSKALFVLKIIKDEKKLLRQNKKHFSSFSKGIQSSKSHNFFGK